MKDIAPKQKDIRKQILSHLEVFEPATEKEIIASFNYRAFQTTIRSVLRQLELKGEIIYSPKTKLFKLAYSRRNSA
ncbi:UNVERIFIED_CONTAM: hypothetical protein BEN50_04885 [Euhalothece sp. KZN 001]